MTSTRKTRTPGEGDDQNEGDDGERKEKPSSPEQAAVDRKALQAEVAGDLGDTTNWAEKSWKDAMAAGVTKSTLCKDGWYVPDVHVRRADDKRA